MLTAAEIRNTQFTMTRRHPGYDPEEVDTFLARTEAELGRLARENDELRRIVPRPPASAPGAEADPGPLTPAEVRNTRFALTQGYPGYDRGQVDVLLARTEAELSRLIRENEELRGIVPAPLVSPRAGQPFKLTIIVALFMLACAIGCGFGIAWMHSDGQRSSSTQASGIAETATVTSVTTTGPKNPQTDISVLLGTPVDYQFVSDVYVPGDHSYHTGDKIRVLVDPRDPSYSELPGQPDARMWPLMISTALLGLLFAATAIACLARAFRIRQRRRPYGRHLPAAPSGS